MSLLDTNLDPVLSARQLTRRYGSRIGCKDVSLDLWPGEVLGIVGIFHDDVARNAVADRIVPMDRP